nr:MAG TPA: hypothetical protein [Caudoviricetes sp.]
MDGVIGTVVPAWMMAGATVVAMALVVDWLEGR